VPGCNNGVVDAGETCDTAIASGPGSCPTSCSDGMACTTDTLSNGGTCTALCAYPPITMPANGDGCCPPGANANNDNNCTPVCGNGVMEGTEECDDGDTDPNDGCDMCDAVIQPTAFRMTDLDLRDPHVYVNAVFCQDATDTPVFGIFAVNTELSNSITMDDDDEDTYLDLNIVLVFRPIDQGSSSTTVAELHFGDCTSTSPTTCYPDPDVVVSSTMNMSSACLGALPNTLTTMYTPEIAAQTGPCFLSDAETITIDLSGIPVTLSNARVAAQYLGTPATQFVNGLVRGFISEASANTTPLPADLPLVGGQPLAQQLPGGDPPGSGNTNCAGHSDKDMDGATPGWWMYLNFTASQVVWDE
jgi:cysteine-rich repeat protein